MRFRGHEIADIRRGELTLVCLPYERRPLHLKTGHFYVLERVDDVRIELEDGGARYEPRARTLAGEFVQIAEVRKAKADDVSDAEALLHGFESAEDWRDAFECDYGEFSHVWIVRFAYTLDAPSFMAIQGGQEHPEQYVGTQVRAIDDVESVGEDYLKRFADAADPEIRRKQEIRRLEARRNKLDEQIQFLRGRGRKAA